MRRIASPKMRPTESWTIFLQSRASGESGMVLVTTSCSMADSLMRLIAGPLRTGCTAYAKTRLAPQSSSALAPCVRVPAVSTMSSSSTPILPRTSPIRFMTSATLGLLRRLSTMARVVPRRLA